ncbi:MAG: hypothetical protein JRJ39_16100 [Deltaproteobacteria bacterium]|nr:hypothetical protein [Deltaproteobacteria bacterium]
MSNRLMEILLLLSFVVSMVVAFWLINFNEMVKAFIGIAIINIWFFGVLILHFAGYIQFADQVDQEEDQKDS